MTADPVLPLVQPGEVLLAIGEAKDPVLYLSQT
jgi:hypothetical protein